jgi:DNA end-binding protein Ku
MRSMWKGAISFGLVMIPVKLYAATEQKDIAFRQVHREDGGRIRFRRVCSIDGAEVPYEDVAKGFELPGGEMVILTEEDMAELPLASSKSIEVMHFAPADQLDPILFNRSYYVEPEATGVRAYALLRDALERSGRLAIAQVALRQRESLATLRSRDGVLVLETLLWPDEVRAADFGFLAEDVDVRSQELRMATSLIDSMTVDFDPEEYHDRYREALQELVDAKVEGRDIIQPEEAEEPAVSTSLADALRASLVAARGDQPPASDPKPATKRAAPGRSARTRSSRPGAGQEAADGESADKPAARRTAAKGTAAKGTAKTGAAKTGAAKSSAAKSSGAKGTAAAKATAATRTTRSAKNAQADEDVPAADGAAPESATQRRTRRKAS